MPPLYAHSLSYVFRNFIDKLLPLGWEHVEDPTIRGPLAEAVRHRLALHDRIFTQQSSSEDDGLAFARNDPKRRLLTSALMALPPFGKDDALVYVYGGLLLPKDVPWAITQLKIASVPSQRARWASILCKMAMRYWNFDVLDPIIAALEEVVEFRQVVPYRQIVLGSPESRWMRRAHRQWVKKQKQWKRMTRVRKEKLPPAQKRIRACLQRFADGDQSAGWQLHHWMMIDPENGSRHNEFCWDLTELPGWKRADDSTHEVILNMGREYLLLADDASEKWLGQSIHHLPAAAGYRYLCLVDKFDSTWLDRRSGVVWRRWASIILAFPTNGEFQRNQQLVSRVYRNEPSRVLAILERLLEKDHETHDYPFVLQRMDECWDERLGRFLLDFTRRPDLKPKFLGNLLDALLAHKVDGAVEYAMSILALPAPASRTDRLRMHAAAHALLAHALDAGWSAAWPVLRADPAFGREVFLTVANDVDIRRSRTWGQDLLTADVTDLYLWLESQFPKHEDPQHQSSGFHAVTPRDAIGELRDGLLSALVARGTLEAVAAIERIRRELPERDLTWEFLAAKQAAAQGTWGPRTPREIIEIRPTSACDFTLVEGDLDMGNTVAAPADIVIICALPDPELDKVKKAGGHAWTELPVMSTDPHSYYTTSYTTVKGAHLQVVAAAPNHMGMPASAVLATKMIIRFRPRLVAWWALPPAYRIRGKGSAIFWPPSTRSTMAPERPRLASRARRTSKRSPFTPIRSRSTSTRDSCSGFVTGSRTRARRSMRFVAPGTRIIPTRFSRFMLAPWHRGRASSTPSNQSTRSSSTGASSSGSRWKRTRCTVLARIRSSLRRNSSA